jgi:hypothetical protein
VNLDFAAEYAKKSDAELRLLLQDWAHLVQPARDALQVELSRRQLPAISGVSDETLDEEASGYDDGDAVVVSSSNLRFPQICPRCLNPIDGAFVKISSPRDFLSSFFPIIAIWRYLFSLYSVPFCRRCAHSLRIRKWVIRLMIVGIGILSFVISEKFSKDTLAFLACLIIFGVTALGLWKLFGIEKRWPGAGITILRDSYETVELEFAQSAYQAEFVKLNRPLQ